MAVQNVRQKWFELDSTHGKIDLHEEVKKHKFTVLVFYRGGWCPNCNMYLKSLKESYNKFTENGAVLLAISSDKPEELRETDYPFPLLFDENCETIINYCVFVENVDNWALKNKKQDFAIPSVFILDMQGNIIWEQISNEDFHNRPSPDEIISHFG